MQNSQKTVKTRFAPSPTGDLHIGGARVALYCWLYAKQHNGQFILRIEDTDLERSTPESVKAILDGMAWLNLPCDEGPFYQTERFDRYQAVIQQLLDSGDAYRCYCSKERLAELRESQIANKQQAKYDGRCRHVTEAQSAEYVIRFKNPIEGSVDFEDLVRGPISIANAQLDDLIIARSDGSPTYNLTVVVDDWDMQITHVIRGDDHINNTPRQINILQALKADIPQYAHLPMILGEDGKRLSKRHGAASVMAYRDQGFLPEAVLNYLVRLGWSHGDAEVFTRQEMIDYFDFAHVSKSPAAMNREKFLWLNQHYMKEKPPAELVAPFQLQLAALGVLTEGGPELHQVIALQLERCKTLHEMAEKSRFFFEDYTEYDENALKQLRFEILNLLQFFKSHYADLNDWQPEAIHQVIYQASEHFDLKLGKVAQPLRVAVSGGTVSPPLDVTLWLLGKEKVLQRLEKTMGYCQTLSK